MSYIVNYNIFCTNIITNQLNSHIKIFPTPSELAANLAQEMSEMINASAKRGRNYTIALSGGSTPELLFSFLGDQYSDSVDWRFVHLFWGDERCVHPSDNESNYGMTYRTLIKKIDIPESNIHRIRGEENPEDEAVRYSEEISAFTLNRGNVPVFDLVILGLGEDGHTASIFPGKLDLFESKRGCEVAVHPVSAQKRISITGEIINNAETVIFLVSGIKKAAILEKIISKEPESFEWPAALVTPLSGDLRWYIDEEAGSLLSGKLLVKS